MNKEYELLKINYEDSNSWSLGFLAFTITSLIGAVALNIPNLGTLTIIFLLCTGFSFIRKAWLLNKIRDFLK